MMPNFLVLAAAALIPLLIGAIWYNPKVFGTAWRNSAGLTENDLKRGKIAVIMGLTYVFSFFIAMALLGITIHQMGVLSTLQGEPGIGEPGNPATDYLSNFLAQYGDRFRTFKHGALHGTISGLFLALPILGVNALFERKGFKYIAINVGFWVVSLALMGGVICQWGTKTMEVVAP
ncbi:hypothetical protein BH09BAC1_BH09BAC1_13020 [soil metagenome]